ncbi:hypothetical protein CAEBREN_05307 [Caenorhabditis brenneri]|uniref:Major sperm protein n=1 Tax=Caenorhabditis brenneri TaxID=135651 RepID=G0N0B7_CAEBE|nr:hypothetical protein CAEBREN_05307 [Caenorhabditis brenneri]
MSNIPKSSENQQPPSQEPQGPPGPSQTVEKVSKPRIRRRGKLALAGQEENPVMGKIRNILKQAQDQMDQEEPSVGQVAMQNPRASAPPATSMNPSAAPPPPSQQRRPSVKRTGDSPITEKPPARPRYGDFGAHIGPKNDKVTSISNAQSPVARWPGVQNPPCNTKQKTGPPDHQILLSLMLSHQSAQAAKSGSSTVARGMENQDIQGRGKSGTPPARPVRTEVVPEPVEPEIEMEVDPTVIEPVVRIDSAPQAFPAPQQLRIIKAKIDSDIEILKEPEAQDPAPSQPVPNMSESEARRLQEIFTELSTLRMSQQMTDGLIAMIGKELTISPRTIRFQWPYNTERNTVLYLENKTDYPISYQTCSNMPSRIVPFNGMTGVIQPGSSVKVDIKQLYFVYEKQENAGSDKIIVKWTTITDGREEIGLIRHKEIPVIYMDKEE